MWLACGTPRHLRGQSRCVRGSSSPGLASLCARAFGCSHRPARPPLCPAADAVREPWAGSALPLATESFLAWGLRGSFPPRKPPSVTISLMTVTHSHCSEAFSPRRGAGRGSWVLGHSGSHGEAAGSRRAHREEGDVGHRVLLAVVGPRPSGCAPGAGVCADCDLWGPRRLCPGPWLAAAVGTQTAEAVLAPGLGSPA